MDEPKYKTGKVEEAAGISKATLKNWGRAERALIKRDTGRLFTFRRAMQVALMARLVGHGLSAELASRVAYRFTDTGSGPLAGLRPARAPGAVFPEGRTVICVYPGELFEVKNIKPSDSAEVLFKPLGHNSIDLATFLDVTFLPTNLKSALEA